MTPEALQTLRDGGTLNDLYRAGMITPKVFMMLEAALKVSQMTKQGAKHGAAVRAVAKMMRVTPKTIYSYLKKVKPE